MRVFIVLSLLLSFATSVMAIEKAETKEGDRPDWLIEMSIKVCDSFGVADTIAEEMNKIINRNITRVDGIAEPNSDQVAAFWNRYISDFTCEVDGKQIHITKYSLDQNFAFYSLFKKYLDQKIQRKLTDKSIGINVNFLIEGETVLDVIDSEISRFEKINKRLGDDTFGEKISKMKRTKKLLVRRFNAKTSAELKKE